MAPEDNFDPSSSHVIPALIRKVYEAMQRGESQLQVWGDGSPTREFLYAEDAARGIVMATQHYSAPEPVNLGAHYEISIRDLVGPNLRIDGIRRGSYLANRHAQWPTPTVSRYPKS